MMRADLLVFVFPLWWGGLPAIDGLEVMEPFVAYAAPRVDPATRAEYLRSWEVRLLATTHDPEWRTRLSALAGTAARVVAQVNAWAAQR
jgi:NAD(P)H dehydrogenase (quinone)